MAAESDSLLRGMSVERDTLVARLVHDAASSEGLALADPQDTELDLTAAFFRYTDLNYRDCGVQRAPVGLVHTLSQEGLERTARCPVQR